METPSHNTDASTSSSYSLETELEDVRWVESFLLSDEIPRCVNDAFLGTYDPSWGPIGLDEILLRDASLATQSSGPHAASITQVSLPEASLNRQDSQVCTPWTVSESCIAKALSEENLKQDLLRRPTYPEPSPEFPDDRLHFLVGEHACAMRLLKVQKRWATMKPTDWGMELKNLICALQSPCSTLKVWGPFLEFLGQLRLAIESTKGLPAGAVCRKARVRQVRTAMLDRLRDIATNRAVELESELAALLAKQGVAMKEFRARVQCIVAEDCGRRGSLLLGTIPEFSEQFKRRLSSRWSWLD